MVIYSILVVLFVVLKKHKNLKPPNNVLSTLLRKH